MKNLILLITILLYSSAANSQGFYMSGRFSNTTPDISLQIDSAAFNFTSTNYTYFINDNPTPSSFGTYYILAGISADTLVLVEDSLGVCSVNGAGTTVMLDIDKTITPFVSIILSETAMSQDSCPTHSGRMSGDFIAQGGEIIEITASVKNTNISTLQAHVYNNSLLITSQYNEKASIDVVNIGGQKIIEIPQVMLHKEQQTRIMLENLSTGIYLVRIRTPHGLQMVKFAR